MTGGEEKICRISGCDYLDPIKGCPLHDESESMAMAEKPVFERKSAFERLVLELASLDDETLKAAFEELSPHEQRCLRKWLGILEPTRVDSGVAVMTELHEGRVGRESGKGFFPGTVVRLASGGPKMTVLDRIEGKVSGITESKTVCRCMFCFEGKLVEVMIPEAALKEGSE